MNVLSRWRWFKRWRGWSATGRLAGRAWRLVLLLLWWSTWTPSGASYWLARRGGPETIPNKRKEPQKRKQPREQRVCVSKRGEEDREPGHACQRRGVSAGGGVGGRQPPKFASQKIWRSINTCLGEVRSGVMSPRWTPLCCFVVAEMTLLSRRDKSRSHQAGGADGDIPTASGNWLHVTRAGSACLGGSRFLPTWRCFGFFPCGIF